jgi:hypothetical protein
MAQRSSSAASRDTPRSVRNALRVRPTLLELEARNQPALLGVSVSVMLPAQVATPAVAAIGIEEPGVVNTPATTGAIAVGRAVGLAGAASAPGLTIAVGVASPSSAVVEVLSVRTIEIVFTTAPITATTQVTSADATGGIVRMAEPFAVHRPAVNPGTSETPSVTTPTVSVPPTVMTPPTTTQTAIATTPTAVAGIAATPTAPAATTPAANATTVATTPFVMVPQTATLTTGQTTGGGGGALLNSATFVGPLPPAAQPPAAATPLGTPAGVVQGDVKPTTEGPPIAGGDTPAEAGAAVVEPKTEEAPAKSSRLPAIIAAAAAVLYGAWHWRRRVNSHASAAPRLSGRGTIGSL